MGTLLGQALKSRQGDQDWLDFFAITSSAFANVEKTTLVPRFGHLLSDETVAEMTRAEAKVGALDKMHGFSIAVNEIAKGAETSWSYHLIILDSFQKSVEIKAYTRDSFEKALADYAEVEARAAQGEKIEPVLVSAGPLKTLRKAYPNFFLDVGDFAKQVQSLIKPGK